MADALCGPSNALQNFQKHSTTDRTLQQDRLTSRASPSQGFRSSPGPSAGYLDPEFEAFQAGQLPLQHPEPQGYAPVGFPALHAPLNLNTNGPASWATDFQNLSLGGIPQAPQQIGHAPQASQQTLGGGWHNEFANQLAQQPNQMADSSYSQHANYNVPFERLSSITPMAQTWQPMQMAPMTNNQEQLHQPQAQQIETFDEEAFARAFDAAAEAINMATGQEVAQEQSQEAQSGVLLDESVERLTGDGGLETERLGADLIHDPRDQEMHETQDDPDALARTAGQLLDSVKDNQSDKFQNSQFLQLMRQLRDHEVTVKGDKIVGVISPEDREALEKSLHSIVRQLSQLDFARVEPLLAANTTGYHPLREQLVIGDFVRTLMRVSAALEKLIATYPDLIQRSKPFGMSIGVEVFALADNPIINNYPALKDLVVSFKQQFSELGIDPRMVRRANEMLHQSSNDSSSSSQTPIELQKWLKQWLDSTPGGGFHWTLSPSQLESLLGPDLYAHRTDASSGSILPPTQAHLDMLVAILGPHVLGSMVRAVEAGPDADYAAMSLDTFADVTRRDWEIRRGLQMAYGTEAQVEAAALAAVTVEQAFRPHPRGEMYLQLEWLEEMSRARLVMAREEMSRARLVMAREEMARVAREKEAGREEAETLR